MCRFGEIVTVLVSGAALSISLWNAGADQITSDRTAVVPKDDESVEVRLARAHLELARLQLGRAQDINKRMPNVIAPYFIDWLELHVTIDEAALEQCLKGEDFDAHQVCVQSAESAVKIAEAELERKLAANERVPTSFDTLEIDRARLIAEIARLNLERIRSQDDAESLLTHLQWQIDELQHDVLELQMRP